MTSLSLSLQTATVAPSYTTGDQLPINAHFFDICSLQITTDDEIIEYDIDIDDCETINTMDASQTLYTFGYTTIEQIERAIVREVNKIAENFDDDADAQTIISEDDIDETIAFVRTHIETAEGDFWNKVRERLLGR